MGAIDSARSGRHADPTLYCAFYGGPQDGFRTGDLPAELSGQPLTGVELKTPVGEPGAGWAVYVCSSETQIGGFWRFDFVGYRGAAGAEDRAA